MPSPAPSSVDFFISYTGKDKPWAEWIAWHLEASGYTVIIQAWDFKAGGLFPADMHRALQQSARVLGVLSSDYLLSDYCAAEWLAAIKEDPTGVTGRLTLVRVAPCELTGLLAGRTYIDLVGKAEADAFPFLLERLKTVRAKPATAPPHPGTAARPSTSAPAFPGLPPNNLPRLDPFFGREKELKQIHDALDPESRTWGTLIDGLGGMGKTSLALRAAYETPPGRFQRIVFVSVKQRELDDHKLRSLDGLSLANWLEMLNEIARELGEAEISKVPDKERPRLLREALRGQKVLLLLDNLESLSEAEQDQLFTFLQVLPGDCKALLTSRVFAGNRQLALELHRLDQPAALLLLEEIARHNPALAKSTGAERIRLWEATDGRPLLLRWTAGQVGTGHCTTIADALDYLRSSPAGCDALAFVFEELLKSFTEADLKVLATLTYPSQAIPIAAIAEISGVALEETRRILKALSNRPLVVPDQAQENYAVVPMVPELLRHKRLDAVTAMGTRLADRAYKLIEENGYQKHDRFPVLEAAWPTVAPTLPLFLAGPNPRLQTVCEALTEFLDFTGRWDERLSLHLQAEAKAVATGDHVKAGWRAYLAGMTHYSREQADEVLACAGRAEEHWRKAEAGARERAIAIRLRGIGHQLKEDYPAAIAAYREALELNRTLSAESVHVAIGLTALGAAERLSGDLKSAERDFREALRIANAIDYPEGVSTFTGNLADLALDRKDWLGAEALAREALSLSEKVKRKELIAVDNHRIAEALVGQGKPAEAQPYAKRAVEIFTQLGSPRLAAAQAILDRGASKSKFLSVQLKHVKGSPISVSGQGRKSAGAASFFFS